MAAEGHTPRDAMNDQAEDQPGATDVADPYALLRVGRDATWEEIIAAYRRQVRWWHPDGLVDATEVERAACELRLRALNIAYHELRIRRGR